ncbi:MAG: pilus assembly protein PilX [Gammaproteobacteria bacterium]|nr:MAG: pilus assembly protein PilX [Gammaproteobacteria bacterium]
MHGQSGAALVIALVFLLLMTLVGVTAMQSTTLQERMAGNLRDRDMALQAAESALREGEWQLQQATVPAFVIEPVSGGGRATTWNAFDWDQADVRTHVLPTTAGFSVAESPRYVIERFPPTVGDTLAADEPLPELELYRVTTRAVGGSAEAVVILQTTFRR